MKNLRRKIILALVVTLLLTAVGSNMLILQGVRLVRERSELRSVGKMEAAAELSGLMLEEMYRAYDSLMVKACGAVEIAHPDHASHYVPHTGHYTHDGHAIHGNNNNAGGGIIDAE